jgi:hypothetical protein
MDKETLPFTKSPIGSKEPRKFAVGFPLLVGEQQNNPFSTQLAPITGSNQMI